MGKNIGEGIKSNKPDSTINVKLPLMNVNKFIIIICYAKMHTLTIDSLVEFSIYYFIERAMHISNDQFLICRLLITK